MATEENSFAERLAYACWLFFGLHGSEPSQTEMAARVKRAQPTVREWFAREKPPIDWEVHAPLADYLGVPEGWLIRNVQPPPEPLLWAWWLGRKRGVVVLDAETQARLLDEMEPEFEALLRKQARTQKQVSGGREGR